MFLHLLILLGDLAQDADNDDAGLGADDCAISARDTTVQRVEPPRPGAQLAALSWTLSLTAWTAGSRSTRGNGPD